jgi:hypothetical protein
VTNLKCSTVYTIAIIAHGCKDDVTTNSVQMKTDVFKQGEILFGDNGNFSKEKLGNYKIVYSKWNFTIFVDATIHDLNQ